MMTTAQREVFNFIGKYIADHDRAPSYDDIARGVGRSKTGIYKNVDALLRDGVLRKSFGKSRSIVIADEYPRLILRDVLQWFRANRPDDILSAEAGIELLLKIVAKHD